MSKKYKNNKDFKNQKSDKRGNVTRSDHSSQNNDRGKSGKYYSSTGSKSYDDIRSNNIKWWNKATGIYESAVRVPFNKLAGAPYYFSPNVTTAEHMLLETNPSVKQSLPVVMRVQYTPGIGVCEHITDAPNRAFQQMYSAVYSKTTGVLEFTPYALAMYVICAQSIAQNIALAKRALETSNLWSAANLGFPRVFLEAMGITPDSVLNHQNEIEAQLNIRIKDFNTIKIPAYIDVFERHYALAHNIYADQDSLKSQFYLFVPECYYMFSDLGVYDPDSGEYDGLLTAMPVGFAWRDGHLTQPISYLLNIIDNQISALRNSADFIKISGSLQRAFPDSSFLTIDLVKSTDVRIPEVDDVISYQVHNAVAVGNCHYATTECPHIWEGTRPVAIDCSITGDPVTGIVRYVPTVPCQPNSNNNLVAGVNRGGFILNTFENTANDEFIMQSTRLMSSWDRMSTDDDWLTAKTLGTEFINRFIVYDVTDYGSEDGNQIVPYIMPTVIGSEMGLEATDLTMEWTIATKLAKFHRAPRIPIVSWFHNGENSVFLSECNYTGDLHHWTTVDEPTLEGLNTAALLSVFSTDAKVDIRS